MEPYNSDILIIGTGLSGLLATYEITQQSDYSINLITKTRTTETNTSYAQGGIAAVLSETDNIEAHVKDTLIAGAGLCRPDVVQEIIKQGPKIVHKLEQLGVKFDEQRDHQIELGREGGHTKRRVAHVTDRTGQAIQEAMTASTSDLDHVNHFENHLAIDLVTINGQIAGAYVLDRESQVVKRFQAKLTILATGGLGKVFLYTSNPDIASGDGLAMAYRAGATVANTEFIQFHPTLYYNAEHRNFLISEAVRGEGAKLLDRKGNRFMVGQHELAELAPRDIVSRAIDLQLKQSGDDYVRLDISHKDPEFIKERFPTIYNTTKQYGLDITQESIPVVPAAHYSIGGVRAKINGSTDLTGLLAIGEVSYTGLHGGNRLASNSLLEAAVMGTRAARRAIELLDQGKVSLYQFPDWQTGDAVDSDEAIIVTHNWDELRRLMWSYVGIVRSTKRLLRAEKRIELLKHEVNQYYWNFKVTPDIIELRNLVQVAELIVKAALFRKESRGAHYTLDYPDYSDTVRDTLIQKNLGVFFSEIIKTDSD